MNRIPKCKECHEPLAPKWLKSLSWVSEHMYTVLNFGEPDNGPEFERLCDKLSDTLDSMRASVKTEDEEASPR